MGDREHRSNEALIQEQQPEQVQEEPSKQRFVGANGNIPPVGPATDEDGNVRELKEKVGRLFNAKFGGDMRKAFDHYGSDGGVTADGLRSLLSDAGVGNGITRGMWVKGVMAKIDSNHDKTISWQEFESVLNAART